MDLGTIVNLKAILANAIRGDTPTMDVSAFVEAGQLEGAANLTDARLEIIYRNGLNSAFNDGQAAALAGPEVSRVIFVATPHRGSFLAATWLGRFARRVVRVPSEVTKMSLELLTLQPPEEFSRNTRGATSIDFMNPGNPTLLALADLPIADGVAVHSIVAVKGDGPIEEGNDGVVEYHSAHLAGVDSEFVVRAEHSCQSRPEVIEEIRRILNVHLEETGLGSATMRPAPALPLPSTGR